MICKLNHDLNKKSNKCPLQVSKFLFCLTNLYGVFWLSSSDLTSKYFIVFPLTAQGELRRLREDTQGNFFFFFYTGPATMAWPWILSFLFYTKNINRKNKYKKLQPNKGKGKKFRTFKFLNSF